MHNIFIVGSKGIPGLYGGYETFVDKLTEYHREESSISYHVACKSDNNSEFTYNNARCFNIKVPNIGPVQAVYYDIAAIKACLKYIQKNSVDKPVIYILACRIGPWMKHFGKEIHKLGGKVYVNPDGHEWKRAKWNKLIRMYWKLSEKLMVKSADLLVCDSVNIELYIKNEYSKYSPATTYIAYGAEIADMQSADAESLYNKWLNDNNLRADGYYLMVGRFVPENNYETVIREFMKSHTDRKLVILTTKNDGFAQELDGKLGFKKDSRICILDPVYDKDMLMCIRKNAYAYIHGHEVGGTNPSLLEALGTTSVNLLLDVSFNREVGKDAAFYWNKNTSDLASLIDKVDTISESQIREYGLKAKRRIQEDYTWNKISGEYKRLWENNI